MLLDVREKQEDDVRNSLDEVIEQVALTNRKDGFSVEEVLKELKKKEWEKNLQTLKKYYEEENSICEKIKETLEEWKTKKKIVETYKLTPEYSKFLKATILAKELQRDVKK